MQILCNYMLYYFHSFIHYLFILNIYKFQRNSSNQNYLHFKKIFILYEISLRSMGSSIRNHAKENQSSSFQMSFDPMIGNKSSTYSKDEKYVIFVFCIVCSHFDKNNDQILIVPLFAIIGKFKIYLYDILCDFSCVEAIQAFGWFLGIFYHISCNISIKY